MRSWPLVVIGVPASVAVWAGWVGLGALCGFGLVEPLPGITRWHLDTAITLPVGVEAYGAWALGAWLSGRTPAAARRFARASALGSLALGAVGQVAWHLLAAWHARAAPWPVVMIVAVLPVVTLGCAAALAHLLHAAPVAATSPAAAGDVAGAVEGEPAVQAVGPAPLPGDHIGAVVEAIATDGVAVTGAEVGRRLGLSAREGQRKLRAWRERAASA